MFSKATAKFVHQIDPEGSLIHVSRPNDSHKLVPMALVVKRNRIWFWQKPKYQSTDFTLNDLLQGDKVLRAGVSVSDFLTYEGTFGDAISGKVDAEAASVIKIGLEGRGSSKLQSSFGKLKKEELDVKELLHDSSNRQVNMQHVLVQQMQKRAELLAVVKERIFTTDSCSITQTKKEQCTLQGMLGLAAMLGSSANVCVKESSNIEEDSDVSLEIPSGTVVAYSILELEIKKSGHFDICLQPGTIGGIEADSIPGSWSSDECLDTVDGMCNGQKALNGTQEMELAPLAELAQQTRCDLFKRLQETLRDRSALSCLQLVLDDLCSGETLDMAKYEELSESQRLSLSAMLDQLRTGGHTENGQCVVPAPLNAAHLLVSAMEELPDETLSLLSESRPDFVEAFDTLMCMFKESSESVSIRCLPVPLQDNQAFQRAEQLLSSASVKLRRDTDRLWTERGSEAGVLPVLLRLSTRGLSFLCKGLK